jgi:aerotaxis receptor
MSTIVPIDEEYSLNDSVIMTETDLDGMIIYANRKFCEVSGYDRKELKGTNQNIVRHPDMPSSVFEKIWSDLQSGKEWVGIIKNLRKDGKYYWVHSFISPILKEGSITGYTAVRRQATKLEIEEAKEDYGLQ